MLTKFVTKAIKIKVVNKSCEQKLLIKVLTKTGDKINEEKYSTIFLNKNCY